MKNALKSVTFLKHQIAQNFCCIDFNSHIQNQVNCMTKYFKNKDELLAISV